MKLITTILLSMLNIVSSFAQGIKFQQEQNKWDDILKRSRQTNKVIFVDVSTKWCTPCRAMEMDVFTQKKVGDFYNKEFISVKLDAEVGWGKVFAKNYKVSSYPTYFFISPKDAVLLITVGSMSENQFLEIGKSAILNQQNNIDLTKFDKGFNGTGMDIRLLQNYIKKLSPLGTPNALLIEAYLHSIPKDSLSTPLTFFLVTASYTGSMSTNTLAFQVLLNAYDKYPVKSRELMSAWSTLNSRMRDGIDSAGLSKNAQRFGELINAYEKLEPNDVLKEREQTFLRCRYDYFAGDFKGFADGFKKFAKKFILYADTAYFYNIDRRLYEAAIKLRLQDQKGDLTVAGSEFRKIFLSETERTYTEFYNLLELSNKTIIPQQAKKELDLKAWEAKGTEFYRKNPINTSEVIINNLESLIKR